MTKLLAPLALVLTTLTGCELYFGGDGDNDSRWTYCAADGYYDCYGDDCTWVGPNCPSEPGYQCDSDADCAAGCYCGDDGTCEEAGFCATEEDCPDGFHCDVNRASCVPDACSTDADCDAGEYCDGNGGCIASCVCDTDEQAQAAGFGYCDEPRSTCMPPSPNGTCGGTTASCNVTEPTCAAGSVALILDGCYTGQCSEIATCDVTPTCEALQHAEDCNARDGECRSLVNGVNCTRPGPNGTTVACMAGDMNCTCESLYFAACVSN
ncbi:MAG TPA: hypothetical protein VM513_26745 [Kofleriaceae bacterium]|jgi:hypothetical protein|nr:hypothetical protein [Kofleriaceae bacterium]